MGWLERTVRWIAVTDSVPPMGRCVLATTVGGVAHEAYLNRKGKWRWSHGSDALSITHWMELPTAPAQFELNRVSECQPGATDGA